MKKDLSPQKSDKCVVCDNPLNPLGRKISVGRGAERLYFCSVGCFKRYETSPETYLLDDDDEVD
jgi:YHS domain-containing protein